MVDLGQYDARKPQPVSQREHNQTHNRHQARAAALRAELDKNPQALTGDAKP